jgi:capsular polysaccharide biosynthesis protein
LSWKSWHFGRKAAALPRVKIHSEAGEGWSVVDTPFPKGFAVRHPSGTPPETLQALLDNPGHFLVRKRRSWDLLKLSRLHAGEMIPSPQTRLFSVRDGWVHLPSGSVISRDRHVLEACSVAPRCLAEGHSRVSWEDAPRLEGRYFLMATAWGNNFAHWLMDSLPRLSGVALDGNVRLLLGAGGPAFQDESLDLLGFASERCIRPKVELVRCEELIVHAAALCSGLPHPEAVAEIRSRMLENVPPGDSGAPCRLYVSRQSTRRTILNHETVSEVLDAMGFVAVEPENTSFRKQVQLFSGAPAVFGPHGAGTMNTIFQPAGGCLVEAYNPLVWDHAAHRIASLCGVKHFHLFGDNCGPAHDMTLEPALLRKTLSLALGLSPLQEPCLLEKHY